MNAESPGALLEQRIRILENNLDALTAELRAATRGLANRLAEIERPNALVNVLHDEHTTPLESLKLCKHGTPHGDPCDWCKLNAE